MFGLVPAALMGVDLERFLLRTAEMVEACRLDDGNPGLELGERLGTGWREGRDKVQINPNPGGFGLWAEQLIAESTGKQGKGLVPAPGETGEGPDRQSEEVRVENPYELGQEFFRWEFGTAVAGALIGINPFDQPNVQEAKDRTKAILDSGDDPELEPEGVPFAGAGEGDYVAILAFVEPNEENDRRIEALVDRARTETGCVVTHGYGPRYLHSTGQLHKGGPPSGVFLQVVDDPGEELPIPGQEFGFGRLIRAQAAGDYAALKERGLRVARASWEDLGSMKLAMVGLGRMGGNMVKRLEQDGHELATYARSGGGTASSLEELVGQLEPTRVVWLMIPAGDPTEGAFQELLGLLDEGDVIVDGGNSNFRDSQRRHGAGRAKRASTSWTPASRAASGGSRSAIASWSAGTTSPCGRSSPRSGRWRPRTGTPTLARRAPGTS